MFSIGNYVKVKFENRRSKDKKYKNLNKNDCFYLHSWFLYMVFLPQRLIFRINIGFSFVFRLFFEQAHLLNLIFSGFYAKK